VIVSSSVEITLLTFELGFCWDAAVAHVLSVLSEGVVSENRCWDSRLLPDESSLSRDFSVSGEYRRGLENYKLSVFWRMSGRL
jgi:hypothetical protein